MGETGYKDGSQKEGAGQVSGFPSVAEKPGRNVEMNCCCFSGSKFGEERGVAASAPEVG